jgi:small-conductance mechanosensitive channel
MKIPNAELGANSISNLSIVDSSQVEQSLRFDHSTIDTIPRLVKEIKSEIKAACPKLISDSSRPFRVHWTEYGESFLQIDIDTRFNIKPHSDEYYDNKQEVLLAISRAIRKCNVRLYEDP